MGVSMPCCHEPVHPCCWAEGVCFRTLACDTQAGFLEAWNLGHRLCTAEELELGEDGSSYREGGLDGEGPACVASLGQIKPEGDEVRALHASAHVASGGAPT